MRKDSRPGGFRNDPHGRRGGVVGVFRTSLSRLKVTRSVSKACGFRFRVQGLILPRFRNEVVGDELDVTRSWKESKEALKAKRQQAVILSDREIWTANLISPS